MKLQPLGDRVVVRADAAETKTASGIIIPDTAKEKPQMGQIVAVGSGKVADNGTPIKMSVKKGDKVFHKKFGYGRILEIDRDTALINFEKSGTKMIYLKFLSKDSQS